MWYSWNWKLQVSQSLSAFRAAPQPRAPRDGGHEGGGVEEGGAEEDAHEAADLGGEGEDAVRVVLLLQGQLRVEGDLWRTPRGRGAGGEDFKQSVLRTANIFICFKNIKHFLLF